MPSRQKKKSTGCYSYFRQNDFKPTMIKKDKEEHYIMIKYSIRQEDITFLNRYTTNTGTLTFIKHIVRDLQRDLYNQTIRVGDINTPLTVLDRSSRQKTNKDIQYSTVTPDNVFYECGGR